MSVDRWEAIMRRADRGLARLTAEQMTQTRAMLQHSMRRTLVDARVAYTQATSELAALQLQPGASFRLARALAVADEIEGTIRALGEPDIITQGLGQQASAARVQAQAVIVDVTRTFGDPLTLTTPMNHRAVEAVVRNAGTRLAAHGETTIRQVQQHVVDGLVRGRSWGTVARDIRADTGMLARRAEMIAHTELHSAQADARREVFAAAGIEYVIRYVTDDDRTCGQCAPRQGEVLRAAEAVEVLHPYCRCVLAPFRPDWVEAGGLPEDDLIALRQSTLQQMEGAGTRPLMGPAPFERGTRVQPVWTPGDGIDRLRDLGGAW